MPSYQQYQRYRPKKQRSGYQLGKIAIILAIIFVVYLIGRSIFGGGVEVESVLPVDENTNVESTELVSETSGDANANSNENTNADTNVNVDVSSAGSIDIENCTKVYSSGSSGEKRISLTFNVGTSKEGEIQNTLNALSNSKTTADFFARGDVAEDAPDLIEKISSAGFPVYNLSYSHPYFTDLPVSGITEQLEKADSAISQRTGKTTKPFFRPPYGDTDDDVLAAVVDAGYCPVTWTVDAYDWSGEYTAAQSKERVLSSIGNGSIVLMQAANSITAEILPEIISTLKEQGYSFVHIDALLGI